MKSIQTTSAFVGVQGGIIPLRMRDNRIEVCLIRTSGKKWGIPKGHLQSGEGLRDTAIREAFEEAGLKGKTELQSSAVYRYLKNGEDMQYDVYLFYMWVGTEELVYAEASKRKKKWVSLKRAALMVPRIRSILLGQTKTFLREFKAA